MNVSKIALVLTLSVIIPVTQAYAVVPDMHSVISDITESTGSMPDINISGPDAQMLQSVLPQMDFTMASSIISNDQTSPESLIEMQTIIEDDELFEEPVITIGNERFWTKGKIIAGATILLSTGLLLSLVFLLSGSGGGSGSGSGSGAGGGSGSGGGGPDPSSLIDDELGDGNTPPPGGEENSFPPIGGGGDVPGGDTIEQLIDNGGGLLPGGGNGIPGGVPHNPEPSTFLLMGLGLLVPGLRKRFSR